MTQSQAHRTLAPIGVSYNNGAYRGKWSNTGTCRDIREYAVACKEYSGIQQNTGGYRGIQNNTIK